MQVIHIFFFLALLLIGGVLLLASFHFAPETGFSKKAIGFLIAGLVFSTLGLVYMNAVLFS